MLQHIEPWWHAVWCEFHSTFKSSKGYKIAPKISNESKKEKKHCISISLCSLKKLSVRSKYICVFLQNYCISPNFIYYKKYIYIFLYFNTSAFSHKTLHSLAKHLLSLAKLLCSPRNVVFTHKTFTICFQPFAISHKTIVFPWKTLRSLQNIRNLLKNYCSSKKLCVHPQNICNLLQNYCVSQRNVAFAHKTFAISRKTTVFPRATVHLLQNLYIFLKSYCIPL